VARRDEAKALIAQLLPDCQTRRPVVALLAMSELWKQSLVFSLALLLALGQLLAAQHPTLAALGVCSPNPGSWHMGVDIAPPINAYGVQANMSYVNPLLCDQAGNQVLSLSAAWVALTGTSAELGSGNDIYQVGWMKCDNCGVSAAVVKWFWAYGHDSHNGVCGTV
jgi:hypothetical protein